jgi:hypothetical protein
MDRVTMTGPDGQQYVKRENFRSDTEVCGNPASKRPETDNADGSDYAAEEEWNFYEAHTYQGPEKINLESVRSYQVYDPVTGPDDELVWEHEEIEVRTPKHDAWTISGEGPLNWWLEEQQEIFDQPWLENLPEKIALLLKREGCMDGPCPWPMMLIPDDIGDYVDYWDTGEGNGSLSGWGTYKQSSNYKTCEYSYTGGYKDSVPDGQGVLGWPNGHRFEGEFRDGRPLKGTYKWPDGRTYTGEVAEYCVQKHLRRQNSILLNNEPPYDYFLLSETLFDPELVGTPFEQDCPPEQPKDEDSVEPSKGLSVQQDNSPKVHSESGAHFSDLPEDECMPPVGSRIWRLKPTGTFAWTNAKITEPYAGKYKDGIPHGHGTLRWPNGDCYIGQFKHGKFHGQGAYSWGNSTSPAKYEGEYRDGRKHGVGSFVGPEASYKGDWRDGRPHGYGASHHPRAYGEDYWGDWKDGKRHGRGTIAWYGIGHCDSFKGGGGYYGDFKDNKFHGTGILTWPLELNESLCWGEGYVDGQIGFLEDLLNTLFSSFDGAENPIYPEGIEWNSRNPPPRLLKVYSGKFKDGTRNGRGTFLCPGRSVILYEGDYKNGRRHGEGILRTNIGTSDEAEFSGDWRHGVLERQEAARKEATVALLEELERTGQLIIRSDCFSTETEYSGDSGREDPFQGWPFDILVCTIACSQAAIIADENVFDVTPKKLKSDQEAEVCTFPF